MNKTIDIPKPVWQRIQETAHLQHCTTDSIILQCLENTLPLAVATRRGPHEYELLNPYTGSSLIREVIAGQPRQWAYEHGYRLWQDYRDCAPPYLRPNAVVGMNHLDGLMAQIENVLPDRQHLLMEIESILIEMPGIAEELRQEEVHDD